VTRCAVLGAGAWGTALADLLARNGEQVTIWALEPDVVTSINTAHEHPVFLAGAKLDERLRATDDLDAALNDARLVCVATPSQHLRTVLRRGAPSLSTTATLCVASKGIEQGTLALMSDVVCEEAPSHQVVALSGPSFAAEVVAHQPTAIVAASSDPGAAEAVQDAFSNSSFRVYTHDDIIGVELGGSLKNVMAVATGICEGLDLGFNARAALITRGLAEMMRLGLALGADAETFAGLAGLGDLVLTCTGSLSRNRALGVEIGRGKTLDETLAGRQTVAEGVITTRSTRALAERLDVEMPIVRSVYDVLFEGRAPRDAMTDLMARDPRAERDD